MKNNKGFTLVELMAVIVVLAIIISIAVPSAISISNKIKKNMYKTKVEMIESSAKIYGQDNPSSVGSDESCSDGGIVTVKTLVDKGYIKKDDTKNGEVLNPVDNSPLNNHTVCIYEKYKRIYAKFNGTSTGESNNTGNVNNQNGNGNDVVLIKNENIEIGDFSGTNLTLSLSAEDLNCEITKYVVRYGTSASTLTNSKTIETSEKNTTISIAVTYGNKYYFQVFLYNGNELKGKSEIISKTFNAYRYYTTLSSTGTKLTSTGTTIYYRTSSIYKTINYPIYYNKLRAYASLITNNGIMGIVKGENLPSCSVENNNTSSRNVTFSTYYNGVLMINVPLKYKCVKSVNNYTTTYNVSVINSTDFVNHNYGVYNGGIQGTMIPRLEGNEAYSVTQSSTSIFSTTQLISTAGSIKYKTDTLYGTSTLTDTNTSVSGRTYFTTSYSVISNSN